MNIVILLVLVVTGGSAYLLVGGVRRIPTNMVGLVHKRFGRRHPDDDPRVSVYGGLGPQAQVLRTSSFSWLPPLFYKVRRVPQTHVPNGTIGVVVAKAGAVRPPGSPMARHVECDFFRDGTRFLRGGGEQGRQLQVLPSGHYEINTDLFEVITTKTPEALEREGLADADLHEIKISIGETGVVITHMGAKPDQDRDAGGRLVEGHADFQQPWEFLARGGQKGVQQETFDEGGRYVINPWFAHVVRIPTRVLILEWTKEAKSAGNLDIALEQIVLDVQGHTVRLDMKQTVQIPAEAAPRLVRRFGDLGATDDVAGRAPVQQFVEKELASTVAGYFRRISARYRIQEFITKYDEVCTHLAAEVRQALDRTGVRAITTTLEEFVCDQSEINALRRQIALQQEKVKLEEARLADLEAQRNNAVVSNDIERQKILVEKERRKLDHIKLQTLVDLLGPDQVALERLLAESVKAGVPLVVSGGGADGIAQTMLQAMPFAQARELVMAMANGMKQGSAQDDSPLAVTNAQSDRPLPGPSDPIQEPAP
jgi:hypothetical protein